VGVMGTMAPHDSTPEFGKETLEASAEIIVREVDHRLQHPECYAGHGNSLLEGLWRADDEPGL